MINKIYTDETVNRCKRCIKRHGKSGLITFSFLNVKLANTSAFINRKYGSAWAVRNAVAVLVADGFIVEVQDGIFKLVKD